MPIDSSRFNFGRGVTQEALGFTSLLQQGQQVQARDLALDQQRAQIGREQQVRQALAGIQQPQMQPQPEQAAGLGGALAEQPQPIMTQEEKIRAAQAIDPAIANKMIKDLGLDSASKRAEMSRFAAELEATPFDARREKIEARVQKLRSEGRDPTQTEKLLGLDEATQNKGLLGIQLADLSTKERLTLRGKEGAAGGLDVKSSDILPDGTTIQVMKDGSTRVTSPEGTVLAGENRSKAITKAQEFGIDIQQRRSQARGVGAMTSKKADQLYTSVEKMQSNNDNLRELIAEVRGGGQSGPLIRLLPTLTTATQRLENVKNRLGLDVVGSVTFGALSEGELKLAKSTAVPDLPEQELVKWAEDKINAQEKLANYLSEQAAFLEQPGNTRGDWAEKVRRRKAEREEVAPTPQTAPQPTQVIRFDAQGNII